MPIDLWMTSAFLQTPKAGSKRIKGEGKKLRFVTLAFHFWRKRGMIRRYEGYMHFSLGKINDNYIAVIASFPQNAYTPICSVGIEKAGC
jgi:hypothetical protein